MSFEIIETENNVTENPGNTTAVQTPSIRSKLRDIQQNLQAPKTQYNKFGDFKYRSAEDILKSVKPLLDLHGLILTLDDDLKQVGDRYYVKATAKITDIKSGDSIETHAWAREELAVKGSRESQITGASSSYARKYAMNGLFAIDDVKDADSTNKGDEIPQNVQTAPPQENVQNTRNTAPPQAQPQYTQAAPQPQNTAPQGQPQAPVGAGFQIHRSQTQNAG